MFYRASNDSLAPRLMRW